MSKFSFVLYLVAIYYLIQILKNKNSSFGALFAGEETGIIYNNEMDDFSSPFFNNLFGFIPSESNYIEPGKSPMSSMTPMIVTDNQNNVKLVLG